MSSLKVNTQTVIVFNFMKNARKEMYRLLFSHMCVSIGTIWDQATKTGSYQISMKCEMG